MSLADVLLPPIATFPTSDSDSQSEEDMWRSQVRMVGMEAKEVVWPPLHGVKGVCAHVGKCRKNLPASLVLAR